MIFKQWKNRLKNRAELEIILSKLEFLANEFVEGRDRKVDVVHWRNTLEDAEGLYDGTFAVRHAIEAYRKVFHLYLDKYELTEEVTINELIDLVSTEKSEEDK